jgi:hypothetical protein
LQQRNELPVEVVELVEARWTHEAGPAAARRRNGT